MPEPTPVKSEAQVRGELIAPSMRRHAWINIVGPLCAIFLGVAGAAIYLKPIGTLRWIQQTRLAWSGVTQNEIALDDGLMTYYITGGYWDQDPVVMVHGLGPNAALVWRNVMSPIADAHYKVVAPNLYGFAGSEHKQIDYSIAYQAGALAQLIDKLKLEHINLVGSDLGAERRALLRGRASGQGRALDSGFRRDVRRGGRRAPAQGDAPDDARRARELYLARAFSICPRCPIS